MIAIPVQQKVALALDGENNFPTIMKYQEKAEMLGITQNSIILNMSDRVLGEASKNYNKSHVQEGSKETTRTRRFEILGSCPCTSCNGEYL